MIPDGSPDALVDASYLVALGYPRDRNHARAKTFATTHKANLLILDVALVEVIYNLQRLGGVTAMLQFSRLLVAQTPQFVPLTAVDFVRALSLMEHYRDAELDFVDCYLTALAERLNITHICTFDRRDFTVIRPLHIEYFDLLP